MPHINPHLILNMDETALDSTRPTKKIQVVSRSVAPRPYKAERGENHIMFVAGVGITGWSLTPMVIINTQTVTPSLGTRFGFPVSHNGHITTSDSAYINDELFGYWVDEILVPGVQNKRKQLDLREDEPALLILDRCFAHDRERLKQLSKHCIEHHFLLPHSSHLTQPLDRGVFSAHKQILKRTRFNDTDNRVANRVVAGLKALHRASDFVTVQGSFWRAGLQLRHLGGKPWVKLNVETWLTQDTSPQSGLKEALFVEMGEKKEKRLRTAIRG